MEGRSGKGEGGRERGGWGVEGSVSIIVDFCFNEAILTVVFSDAYVTLCVVVCLKVCVSQLPDTRLRSRP